jgi:glycine cleavage system H protein
LYHGCEFPPGLAYDVERDVWVRPEPDGTVTIGMTDPAQARCGKLQHVHFKKVGRSLAAGQSVATVESAKWAGPMPTPLAGILVATNAEGFARDRLLANRDPYGAGWFARIRPEDGALELAALLRGDEAVAAYEARIQQLGIRCVRCEG